MSMSISMVNTLITAVVTALQSGTPVADRITRVGLAPVPNGVALAVDVRPMHAEVKQANLNPGVPISWTTAFTVTCYARAGAGQAADEAVDQLLTAVYARLLQDPTLGGACLNLAPRHVAYEFDADAQLSVGATLTFTALQRAGASTLTP